MEILRLLFFLVVVCSSHAWSDSVKHYDGSMGPRLAEFSLEWGENGTVKGAYFYTSDNRSQYKLLGSNKTEGVLELNVYSGDMLTARMSLQNKTKGNSISWDGVLKGTDGKILAVSFSRIPDAPTEQALDAADKSGNGEKVVKDPTNGALVWRPYSSNIQWTGDVNGSGFAEGKGTLVVFDRKGNRAAIFTGIMKDGHIVGDVTAKYPTSPDRAHYVGGFSNWSENGMGTMTYNDGKVVAGNWKNGELVAIKAAEAAVVSGQSGEPAPRSKGVYPAIEPPDPDTAAEVLQKTSALRASLAVPAKFILIVFITLCGFMALGGVRSGMDELKKGNKDKAAMQFAIAAVAGLGARFFHRLIKTLIKERVSMRTQPLPIEE